MKSDVNVSVNVSTSEMEDNCGSHGSNEDLPTAAAAASNGVEDGNENARGNGEDDSDASYVFVAGNDVGADEPAETADPDGKFELVDNVDPRENKVSESEVNPGIANLSASAAVGKDADSPLNNEVTSKNSKEQDDGAVQVSNETAPVVGLEAHGLDFQEQIEEEHVEPLDAQESQEFQVNVEVAVEPEAELLQCAADNKRAGEEDSIESIITQKSADVAESDQNQCSNVEVISSTGVSEAEQNPSSNDEEQIEGERKSNLVTDKKENQHSLIVITDCFDNSEVAESEQSQCGNVEVITRTGVSGSELNQSSNDEDQIEGERKSNLVTDIKENQHSPIVISDCFDNDNDLDSSPVKEPVGLTDNFPVKGSQNSSKMNLEENIETNSWADGKLEGAESTACSEYADNLSASHAQDTASEMGVVNDFFGASQNTAEQSSYPEEVETLISIDAELGRHETQPSDPDTGESSPASNDNDAIGYPTNGIIVPVVQLEPEAANGHIKYEKGENLATLHTEASVPQAAINFIQIQTTTEENKPSEVVNTIPVAPDTASEPAVEIGDSCPVVSSSTDVAESECNQSGNVEITNSTIISECELNQSSNDEDQIEGVISDDMRTDTMVGNQNVNSSESVISHLVGDEELVIEPDSGTTASCPGNEIMPEIKTDSTVIESVEKVSTFSSDEVGIESEVSGLVAKCLDNNFVSVEESVPVDVKAELKIENTSIVPDGHVSKPEVLNGSVNDSERNLDCIENDVNGENRDQLVSIDGLEKMHKEIEFNDGVNREEAAISSPKASVDASDWQNAVTEVVKRPFYYMIRIPRYDDDENLKEQIKYAQFQVDEKTKSRDVIRAEMQRKRADCNECGDCLNAAKSGEAAARELLKAKRKEIDSVLFVINRVKSAFSIEDIDGKIRNMEHMIQHETLPLKEEKNYLREMKQLKQIREQLSSSLGNQDEVQEAIDQKEQVEERLKHLRKEADLLRENVLKAEAATKNAKKKYHDENAKLNELINQFRAADNIRQEAYAHLQSLRKRSYEKNKYFWKYKDDAKAAYDLASKGDREELQCYCVNQVERVMELWNNDDEFRKEYIRCNMRSTVRRLRTLDGRSLGPDEEPPVLPISVHERVANNNIVSSISTHEGEKTVAPMETQKIDDTAKVGDQNNLTVKSKKMEEHAPMDNGLATTTASGRNGIEKTTASGRNGIEKTVVSGRNEIENSRQEEHKQTKEEEELARKAEELRKAEEAALLKEQRRLEEKAKAKEALERKKRNADKALARAALRAIKEAEQKEKEREKKARKKDKRKALAADDIGNVNEGEYSPISETPTETKQSESGEKPVITTITKRSQKPSHFNKQTKSKSMPLPLRNRGKRRMQTWMWVLLSALVVLALFLIGSGSFSLQWLGF
ncbi:uncharacterized protein LOC105635153 [Jatropha curcas]|nr:uncharacterized protein LOC105635153 [Jatropha curcas]